MRTTRRVRLTVLFLAACLLAPAGRQASALDALDRDPEFFAAASCFSNGHYGDAISRLLGLLKRYPRHPRLQMLLADAYEHSGQFVIARKLHEAALANKPDARSAAVAMEAIDRLGQQIERQAAGSAGPADLFKLTPEQVAAMSVVYPQSSRRRTEHFGVTTSNPVLADLLAERVEAIFRRVGHTVLGEQLFAHRIELMVYPDRAAFVKFESAPTWCGGGYLFLRQPDGSIRRRVMLYQVDEQNRFRTTLLSRELPHELAHVALHEYFGQTPCPLWLDEGLASMAEADSGRALAGRMGELLARQLATPLADMIDRISPELDRPTSFYVQAASWTHFLRSSLSDAQMKTFLGHLKDGQKPSVALGRTLFLDDRLGWLVEMEQRWHKSVLKK